MKKLINKKLIGSLLILLILVGCSSEGGADTVDYWNSPITEMTVFELLLYILVINVVTR